MEQSFNELGINSELVKSLELLNIKVPTSIQKEVIPKAIEGKNLIAQGETGSGKTLAFLLPILEKINKDRNQNQCIIIAPTHELSIQIHNTIVELRNKSSLNITSTPIIGGVNIMRQIDKLKSKPQIIVGSCGRILELIRKRKINTNTIETFVIDEGDRLLDRKNIDGVKKLVEQIPEKAQKMIFSATLSEEAIYLAETLMGNFEIVKAKVTINKNIYHGYFKAEHRKKMEVLRKVIHAENPKKAIIFINNSYDVQKTLEKLKFHKINAVSIHGSIKKEDRKRALEDFRKGKVSVLVASDIAARGLDIKDVTHIINLDIPEDSNSYIHRAGRTGRAGQYGVSFSLVDPKEEKLIKQYESTFDIKIPQMYVANGQVWEVE